MTLNIPALVKGHKPLEPWEPWGHIRGVGWNLGRFLDPSKILKVPNIPGLRA
jgi:hypothetical protein